MISSLARTLDLGFNRIQFTPDLMPSDITGTELLHIDPETGARSFRFEKGPLFANVILADEINRTPPKTQAALLEAMMEHQVTSGGKRHLLPDPFFTLATQNPIEQEGTYPLPEAQLDRFMFMVQVGYSSAEEEREILKRTTGRGEVELKKVLTSEELLRLQEAVRAVPIALGGLAGVLSERVAVVNIGIEGMLLAGAFTGALVGSLAGGLAGLAAAVAVGGVFGFVLAALVVTYRMDQIIAGVFINLFVLGLTSYISSQVFQEYRALNNAPVFRAVEIPVLSDLPVLGPVFFSQNIFVYGAFILAGLATYYLFHTRHGLRARAVGEHPRAADTLGIDVYRTRYVNVTIAGMVAGFGGAWFTLGSVGRFDEGMTGGRGFIGLAAMIFGRWHPVGALMAALIFGFADSLQQKLALLGTPIPSEFLAMAPYIVTLLVVAGAIGRVRFPAALGVPYRRE
jgi:simple sugar transport system permease protein